MIQMSHGEICDRYTILKMKADIDPALLPTLLDYTAAVRTMIVDKPWVCTLLVDIAQANAKIWMLEADIRNHKKMTDAEVGRRAIQIRDLNAKRVQAKAEIDKAFGVTPDLKYDHLSSKGFPSNNQRERISYAAHEHHCAVL